MSMDEKMAEAAKNGDKPEYMSIEETFQALDELIDRLERGEGSLEEAFENYEKGMKLVKSCNEKIERIEKQVLVLSGGQTEEEGNGSFV